MPITRTNKSGTSTSVSVSPTNFLLIAFVAGATYGLYKLFVGEERVSVQAFQNLRSKVKYASFNYSTNKWEFKTRPLPLEDHADNAKIAMTGVIDAYLMKDLFDYFLKYYTYNDLRLLHNYWITTIDTEKSIYDWIAAEWANSPEEAAAKNKVMTKLTNAGVGNVLKIRLKPTDYLKK